MQISPKIAIFFMVISLGLPNQGLCEARVKASSGDEALTKNQAYFLDTPGLKKRRLVCGKIKKKVAVLEYKRSKGTSIIGKRLVATNKTLKKLLSTATRECKIRIASPACNDGCDNDSDGTIDYPLDTSCASLTGTSEDDSSVSAYQVFRKPFDGDFAVLSPFDHQYPQEFVHYDDVIVNTDNETTTIGVDGHQGYDFDLPVGTPVLATYDGTVEFAGTEDSFYCPLLGKDTAGMVVILKNTVNGEEFRTVNAHCSSIYVTTGQSVTKGDVLCLSGNTGCSTAPHLHFDIQRSKNTNGNQSAPIDPYGWNSTATDPWSIHSVGTESFPLWSPGEAPTYYREINFDPNPNAGDAAAVTVTKIRWTARQDDLNPNNEYIEITLDSRYATSSSYSLNGFYILNNSGDKFEFPSGTQVTTTAPLRLYSGVGTNSSDSVYWGRSTAAWNDSGDCARLYTSSNFRMYYLYYGNNGCTGVFSASAIRTSQPIEILNKNLK